MKTENDTTAGQSPALGLAHGSSDFRPLELAITGYMKDRNYLVGVFAGKSNAYDSHARDQNMIAHEIERIDRAVAALLQNVKSEPRPRGKTSGESIHKSRRKWTARGRCALVPG